MEIFFGSFIKELIAVIVALFMPFSTVAAAGQADKPKGTRPFEDNRTPYVATINEDDDEAQTEGFEEQQDEIPAPELENE